jgi:hypothetical protein
VFRLSPSPSLSWQDSSTASSQSTQLFLNSKERMTDTNRQIKQMVNFIMQEAHEKVNEIRIKVTRDERERQRDRERDSFVLFWMSHFLSFFVFLMQYFDRSVSCFLLLLSLLAYRLSMISILRNKCLFIMARLKFKRIMHKRKKI